MEYYFLIICALVLTFGCLSLQSRPGNRLQIADLLTEDEEVLAGIESKTWLQFVNF